MYIILGILSGFSALAVMVGTIFFGFTPNVWAYVPYIIGGLISLLAPVCLMGKRYKKHKVWGALTGVVFLIITVAHFVTAAIPGGNYHPTAFLPEGTEWLTVGVVATILLLLVAPIVLALCPKAEKVKKKKNKSQEASAATLNVVPVVTVGLVEADADDKKVHYRIQVKDQPYDGYLVVPVAFGAAPQKGKSDTRSVLYFTIEPGQWQSRRQITIERGGDSKFAILEYSQMNLVSASQKTRVAEIPAYEIAPLSSLLPPPTVVAA